MAVGGHLYEARVIEHSALEYRMSTGEESAFSPRVSVRVANADQALSGLTSEQLWKGAEITIRFVLYDLESDLAACDPVVMLRGSVNSPDEVDYQSIRLSIVNRLGAHRAHLPNLRIQKRCVWLFPRTSEERAEAALAGGQARYSAFHGCGYSADVEGGAGNLGPSGPFTSCNYTKTDCIERGMYDRDFQQNLTRRFAGFQFIPIARLVKGYGEKTASLSISAVIDAGAGDIVPIAYGTVWMDGIVTIGQSDGNLHRMEVMLCSGPIASVLKVIVEGVEVPVAAPGRDMTATGWYNVVSNGDRTGAFNVDFQDENGVAASNPNGGIAILSVVVPGTLAKGREAPRVQVLLQGSILPMYDVTGAHLGDSYTSNPAWVLLDVMRRSGYREDELDLASFGIAAGRCAELITSVDSSGNEVVAPRYDCNVLLRSRRPVAEIIRGIQLGSDISLRYSVSGRLEAFVEARLAEQQAVLPEGSNAAAQLSGGWPAYEFGDGTDGTFNILLTRRGEPTFRLFSRSHAEASNRVTVEFVDPVNDYIIDNYSLVDIDDVIKVGQEIGIRIPAIGVSGQAQASRVCGKALMKSLRGNLYAEFETSIKGFFIRPGDIIAINIPSAGLLRKPFRVLSVAPGFNGEHLKIFSQVHEDEWYADGPGTPQYLGSGCNSCMAGEPRPLLGDAVDDLGEPVYSISEEGVEAADGTHRVRLNVGFIVPKPGSGNLEARPLVSLIPQIVASGGTLSGPQNLYYCISEIDGSGRESQVSTTVHAFIPSGSASSCVQLNGIRTSSSGISLNVYRGSDPWQLRRIASNVPNSTSFTDSGLPLQPFGPPDPNFAKAQFDWRSEYLPPMAVSVGSQTGLSVSGTTLVPSSLKGRIVRVHSGFGAGQERIIDDNSDSEIIVHSKWTPIPDATSTICIADAGWTTGGESRTSPVSFEVPNQSGSVVQIRGYGVSASGVQSRPELSAITRYTVGGARDPDQDIDVPTAPSFGLSVRDGGFLEVGGIGFSSTENVATISSGTFQAHYLDELNLSPLATVGEDLSSTSEILRTDAPVSLNSGVLIRIDSELMRITSSVSNSVECEVERGVYGTNASMHQIGAEIFRLNRTLSTIPIPRQFFGSPGSGDFSYSIPLGNSRVLAADLLFTNSQGNSEAGTINFCSLADGGLRVLSGGQITIQVGGYLGIQSPAAPPIVVEQDRAVRDIFAIVKEPPIGAPVVVRVKRNTQEWCVLTIAAGSTISNIVSGTTVGPLLSMEQVTIDVVSVGQGAATLPGRDLTITIRL